MAESRVLSDTFETILIWSIPYGLPNRSGPQYEPVTVREKHAKVLLRGQKESFAAFTSLSTITM